MGCLTCSYPVPNDRIANKKYCLILEYLSVVFFVCFLTFHGSFIMLSIKFQIISLVHRIF